MTTRPTIDLSTFGVQTVRAIDWPASARISEKTRVFLIEDPSMLTTPQRRVYVARVEDMKKEIERWVTGERKHPPSVKVFPAEGRWWVLDGHHRLAAYLELDMPPYAQAHGRGKTPLGPMPKLYSRTRWRPAKRW